MAITFPRELPSINQFRNVVLRPNDVVAVAESPFSFVQQVQIHQGQRWECVCDTIILKRNDAEVWTAWLTSLQGMGRTFLMQDPVNAIPRGSAGVTPGTPIVNGNNQTGPTLAIRGGASSATGYLKAGDYIQLGSGATSRMYKILQDANTNASGNVTLDIWPSLRSSPADGATVTVANCKTVMRLAQNTREWSIGEAQVYGITFEAIEAL